jgi:hypothetical protein
VIGELDVAPVNGETFLRESSGRDCATVGREKFCRLLVLEFAWEDA